MKTKLSDKFQRVTSSGTYIPEIDGLRFIAITMVVLFHINSMDTSAYSDEVKNTFFWQALNRGHYGVHLFFVISGFIISLPFIRAYTSYNTVNVNFSQFYLRRLTRLEPPFILAMTGFYILAIFMSSHSIKVLFEHFVPAIFYLHGFVYDSRSIINPVSWSLEVEVQFYLLAPLIFQVFKLNKLFRRSIFLLILFIAPLVHNILDPSYLTLFRYFHFFITGAFLADLYLNEESLRAGRSWIFDATAIISLLFILVYPEGDIFRGILAPIIFFFYGSLFKSKHLLTLLRHPLITIIGGMCYSIYLIHLPILSKLIEYLRTLWFSNSYPIDYLVYAFVILPVIMLFSAIYFYYVEKPFMQRNLGKLFPALRRQSV